MGKEKGETICVPVSVSNFNKKDSLTFNLSWDPGLFKYVKVVDQKLVGLKTSTENAFDAGLLGLSWHSAIPSDVSLAADKAEIFKICFELIGLSPFEIGDATNCSLIDIATIGSNYSTSPLLGGQRLENSLLYDPGEICILNPDGFVLFSKKNEAKGHPITALILK